MMPLSPAASEPLTALGRIPSVGERLLGRSHEDLRILGELSPHAQPALIPELLQHVFGADRAVSRASAGIVAHSLAAASAAELVELEDRCRGSQYGRYLGDAWAKLRPPALSRFADLGEDEGAVIGIASFHHSGWVREAAVALMDDRSLHRTLDFLLLRMNDWVSPVAERATLAVRRRLTAEHATAIIDALPVILRLGRSSRRDNASLLPDVLAFLEGSASREDVERGLRSESVAIRRLLYRVARTRRDVEQAALLRWALDDADTVVRVEAAVHARAVMPFDAMRPLLARLLADSYPRVRREAVETAAERLGEDGVPILVHGLLDRNAVVRDIARFHLRRRHGWSDFAAYYRSRLGQVGTGADARELSTAIAGLGETGAAGDAQIVSPFLAHTIPAVRRAGVRAIMRLAPGESLPRVLTMLGDPSPGVTHLARKILEPRARAVGIAALRETIREAPHAHGRFDAFVVAAALGKWDSLTVLLDGVVDHDPAIVEHARDLLRAWLLKRNRSFEQPAPAQVAALGDAIARARDALDAHTLAEMRAVHGYWVADAKSAAD